MLDIMISLAIGLIGGLVFGMLLTSYLVCKEIKIIEKEADVTYAKSID